MSSLDYKIAQADSIINTAIAEHLDGHTLKAVAVLFSGGNDSTTLLHLMRKHATHAIHCNTTIGIEATREFVREQCRNYGLPLLEEIAPVSYADLVTARGFPGPAMHWKMYTRLKERGLEAARNKLVEGRPHVNRVLFIAGRRRLESARRSNIEDHSRKGSIIWASPIADWSKSDLIEYRRRFNVPTNPIADSLGMSGECLCGSFAEPGEFEHIAALHPEVAREIVDLEARVRAAGNVPEQACRWGWGAYRDDPSQQPIKVGPLCSSCDARWDRYSQVMRGGTT